MSSLSLRLCPALWYFSGSARDLVNKFKRNIEVNGKVGFSGSCYEVYSNSLIHSRAGFFSASSFSLAIGRRCLTTHNGRPGQKQSSASHAFMVEEKSFGLRQTGRRQAAGERLLHHRIPLAGISRSDSPNTPSFARGEVYELCFNTVVVKVADQQNRSVLT